MGVTISSPSHSIDLGYFGFFRLRRKIAELLGEDVGIHYDELRQSHAFETKETEENYWKQYDKATEDLANSRPKNTWKVFDFLYASDCEGKATYGACKQILSVIGDYDDDIIYGYVGRPDGARMRDFKALLEDCIVNKRPLKWS